MLHAPAAEIEPRPRVNRADRLQSIETLDGTLQPDRGWMKRADRRKFLIRAGKAHDQNFTGRRVGKCHVNERRRIGIAPQSEQSGAAGGEIACRAAPCVRRHDEPRPRPMVLDAPAFDALGE